MNPVFLYAQTAQNEAALTATVVAVEGRAVKRNLKTISELAKASPFKEGSLRWMVFNEGTNGLRDYGAVIKLGRRVYIDVDRFESWLGSHQTNANEQQVAA